MNGTDSIGQTDLLDALAGTRQVRLSDGHTVSLAAPVILDLDGKGVQTLARNTSGVRYDLDGDGLADSTSWIGSTEGFLFLDRDGNGTVTNAGEFSFLGDVPGATSDLQGLKAFDSTKDGILSSTDARWGDFRIWQDKNGNGVAETSEILTLATAGVRSLNLSAVAYAGANAPGDVAVVAKGSYTRTTGTTMDLIDAALTYVSAPRDGLPTTDFVAQTQSRKAGKYRISVKDGRLAVAPKHGNTSDVRAGGLSGAVELTFKHSTVGMLSAIILDLDGDGVTLKGAGKSRGWFDMNGDGSPDRQGWAGRNDGFLVIDRDGDGRIASGSELSFLAEDPTAGSSMAGLAKLDSNGDKVIDKADARFGELRVWADSNGNGATDAGELKTLVDLGIQSLSIDGRATGDRSKPGDNLLMATATFTYANGMKRTLGDAALAFRPSEPMRADGVTDQGPKMFAAEASSTASAVETSLLAGLGGGETVLSHSSIEYPPLDGSAPAEALPPHGGSQADATTNRANGTNGVARHGFLRDVTSLPAVVPFPSPEPFADYDSPIDAGLSYAAGTVQAPGSELATWLVASSENFAAALSKFGSDRGTGQISDDLSRSSQSVIADLTFAHGSPF